MRFGKYTFKPPIWTIPLVIVLVVVMPMLGNWQLRRAHYTEHLIAVHTAALAAGPQRINITSEKSTPKTGFHYILRGHYESKHQLLLTDQVHGTKSGYRVWTPFVLDSGVVIMVDRGWIPKPAEKDGALPNPPAPTDEISVKGYWKGIPKPLSFGHNTKCNVSGWPRAFSYPSIETIRCQYEKPVADGLLLLNADQPNGFVRDWSEDPIGFGPWIHYIYAVQWYIFTAMVIGLFFHVGTRREDGESKGDAEEE